MLFLFPHWSSDLIDPGTSLYEHILWMHIEKNRTYACTFPVPRKEINVVKVRFTMWYSSRKLSNEKVISTACKFWRQIACSFQVMSEYILFLAKKCLKSRHFFKPGQGIWAKKFTHAHYVFPPWNCSTCYLTAAILYFLATMDSIIRQVVREELRRSNSSRQETASSTNQDDRGRSKSESGAAGSSRSSFSSRTVGRLGCF